MDIHYFSNIIWAWWGSKYFFENQKYRRPPIIALQQPIRSKREYHCESKVKPNGIEKFCVGNPED